MGLVEAVAEHASFKSVSLFVLGALIVQYIASRIIEHIRIRRLGNYGKALPYWWPLGSSIQAPAVGPPTYKC
jgi:hypothetical protein